MSASRWRAPRRRDDVAAAVGLALLVLLPVLVLIATNAWLGVYGQDAYAYHGYATGELRSALMAGRAPGPFPWPPGFPLLVALASLVTGPVTAAGQAVSISAGAAVPVLTWLLARELTRGAAWRPWVAPLAGGMVAVTPHLWQSAAVVMSDTTGLAAMTLGAWAVVRWSVGGRLRWAILGAAAVAFAIDSRDVYAAAALPLVLAAVIVAWRREPAGRWTGRGWTVAAPLLVGLIVLAPVVGPMAWAGLHGTPMPFAVTLTSHAWSPANVLRDTSAGPDGFQRWPLPMGLYAVTQPFAPYHLGLVGGLLAVGGVLRAARRERRPIVLAVLIGWPAVVLLVMAGDVIQNTRFALALLPPAAILAASGVDGAVAWLRRRSGRLGRIGPGALGVGIAVVLLVQLAGAWRFTESFIARFQADTRAIVALDARIPAEDRVIAFGATLALRFAGREALELDDLTPGGMLALATDVRATWLLVPAGGFDGQWAGTPLAASFDAVRDGPGLRLAARGGSWELWSVR